MQRRFKVVMDQERKILPDGHKNYLIGLWDGTLMNAIYMADRLGCDSLVFWPEGLELSHDEYKNRVKELNDEQ